MSTPQSEVNQEREKNKMLESGDHDMVEQWRPIDGYDGAYLISSIGRVLSLPKHCHKEPIIRKPKLDRGYLRVKLNNGNKAKYIPVHRLVAKAFIANPNEYPFINHIDENKTNNCVENLEWCTVEMNANHGTRNRRVAKKLLNNNHCKPVEQLTKNDRVVAWYPSMSEISRASGGRFNRTNVWHCLTGKMPFAYGFKWRYADKKGVV